MNSPSVSIVTVCRNAVDELPLAAESVLRALGDADEWVVQDGASTDGSMEVLQRLDDARVHVQRCADDGIYDAMNRALRRAAGDFLLFLGADDRLQVRIDELRGVLKDAATVYYGDVWRSASADRYAGVFDGAKLARTNICHQAIFYPRSVFSARRFDTRYRLQADWVLNMDCFADPSLRFEYIDRVIATYGQQGQSSFLMDDAFQRDYRRLLKTYFTWNQRWRPILLHRLAELYRSLPGVPAARQKPARGR